MVGLLVLLALAFPAMAIAALVVAVGGRNRLERLERRFVALE
jgi:hypothetical protein